MDFYRGGTQAPLISSYTKEIRNPESNHIKPTAATPMAEAKMRVKVNSLKKFLLRTVIFSSAMMITSSFLPDYSSPSLSKTGYPFDDRTMKIEWTFSFIPQCGSQSQACWCSSGIGFNLLF
jgi:hypothetical protein